VRKHNPLILYDSITNNDTRVRQIKSFVDFQNDIKNKTLPQWAFVSFQILPDLYRKTRTYAPMKQ
jgi:acid phosphatase